MEDYEDDLNEGTWKIFRKSLILHAKLKPPEKFVDFIRGETVDIKDDNSSNQLQSAESLFKSLGEIDYSVSLNDEIKGSDILIVDDNVTNCSSSDALISRSTSKEK